MIQKKVKTYITDDETEANKFYNNLFNTSGIYNLEMIKITEEKNKMLD